MVMDLTKWAQPTDVNLANEPILSGADPLGGWTFRTINGVLYNYTSFILGDPSDGAWLISDIHPDKVWIEWYIYDRSSGGTYVSTEPGDSYRGGCLVSFEGDVGEAENTDLTLAWFDGDQYTKFPGCLSASQMHLFLIHYTDLDGEDYTHLEPHIWVPYWWQRADIIEMMWSLIKHHAGDGSSIDDLMDKSGSIVVSEIIDEQLLHHQLFDFYRQAGESFGRSIQRMLVGTDVWLGTGFNTVGLRLGLRPLHPEALETDSTLLDFDDGLTELNVRAVHVTDGNEYLFNAIESTWGTIANMRQNTDHSGGTLPVLDDTDLPLIASPPGEGDQLNKHVARDEESLERYGRRSVNIEQPFLNSPDWSSAGIDLRWSKLSRVITFTMGPRAFSFNVGDIINVKDSTEGLAGTESFLVIEMTYQWDELLVSVKAIEMLEPAAMSPDAFQVRSKLRAWYQCGEYLESPLLGVYFVDDGLGNIDGWIDQGPTENDATRTNLSLDYPALFQDDPAGFNSLNFVSTVGGSSINAGLELATVDIRLQTGWTIFVVIKANSSGLFTSSFSGDQIIFGATPFGSDATSEPDNGFEFGIYDAGTFTGHWFFRSGSPEEFVDLGPVESDDWQVVALRYYGHRPDRQPRPVLKSFPSPYLTLMVNGQEVNTHRSKLGPLYGLSLDKDDISTQEVYIGNSKAGSDVLAGQCAEAIVYHEALDVHQLKMIDRHLRQKYSIS